MPPSGRKPQQPAASPAARAYWRGILDHIPAAAYTCDAAGLITYFNPLAEAVWGRAPALRDPAHRYCGSFKLYLSDGSPVRHEECWMALALREGRQYNGREILIERSDGSRTLGLAHANPLRGDQGEIVGAINLVADMTAQKAGAGRGKPQSISRGATLAMIEVGVSVLASVRWGSSAFS